MNATLVCYSYLPGDMMNMSGCLALDSSNTSLRSNSPLDKNLFPIRPSMNKRTEDTKQSGLRIRMRMRRSNGCRTSQLNGLPNGDGAPGSFRSAAWQININKQIKYAF